MTDEVGRDATTRARRLVTRGRKLLRDWQDESDILRAQHLFEQAAELAPDYAEAWQGLGDALHALDEEVAALDAYQRAVDLGAGDVTFWRRLARAAYEAPARDEDAVAAAERARALAPNDLATLHEYAAVLTQAGRSGHGEYLERALSAVDHARRLLPTDGRDPRMVQTLKERGGLLILLERYTEALEAYEELESLARAHRWAGEHEAALDPFQRLARLAEDHSERWGADAALGIAGYGRALALACAGRVLEALTTLDATLADAVMPSPLWQPLRAELLGREGRIVEALEEIQPALVEERGIPPPLGYVWHVYAHVLQGLGRHAEAAKAEGKADRHLDQQTPLDALLPQMTYDDNDQEASPRSKR